MSLKRFQGGDTIKITWIGSGATASLISGALLTGSETVISSGTMTSSGNGHYYRNVTLPNTVGYYVAEGKATISGSPFIRRTRFKVTKGEVD